MTGRVLVASIGPGDHPFNIPVSQMQRVFAERYYDLLPMRSYQEHDSEMRRNVPPSARNSLSLGLQVTVWRLLSKLLICSSPFYKLGDHTSLFRTESSHRRGMIPPITFLGQNLALAMRRIRRRPRKFLPCRCAKLLR